jgi:hypothetical protein
MQKSLTTPVGAAVAIAWVLCAYHFHLDTSWPRGNFFRNAGFAFKRHWRERLIAFFLVLRAFLFRAIDVPRLEGAAERVRLERLANSLKFVPFESLESAETSRLAIEPSYQFPDPGSILVPIGVIGYGLLTSSLDKILPARILADHDPAFGKFLAKAVFGELVSRMAVEWIWRYSRLDMANEAREKPGFWGRLRHSMRMFQDKRGKFPEEEAAVDVSNSWRRYIPVSDQWWRLALIVGIGVLFF